LLVVFIVWVMFAILGMNLLSGRLGYCNIKYYYGIN